MPIARSMAVKTCYLERGMDVGFSIKACAFAGFIGMLERILERPEVILGRCFNPYL